MISRTFDALVISFNVLGAVCRSFLANHRGNNKWIPLPPVAPVVNTSLAMDELVARVDKIVRLAIFNTAHPCLYYSYARCCVLRHWGYPVKLNMGLHNLQPDQNTEGHCWISLDGQVLFEEKVQHEMYQDKMGERGDITYWARLKRDEGKTFERLKKK